MDYECIYPLVMCHIAIENDHRNSDVFPFKMVTFHSLLMFVLRLPEDKQCVILFQTYPLNSSFSCVYTPGNPIKLRISPSESGGKSP